MKPSIAPRAKAQGFSMATQQAALRAPAGLILNGASHNPCLAGRRTRYPLQSEGLRGL
ncbi:MAG: hypothetical protein WCI77_05180 [Candidatus Omnitrophota bacterium]